MTNEVEKSNRQEDEISLKELILKIREWWRYLWSKKWIIVAAGIIGGALGLTYSLMKKPVYTATTTFVLESGEKSGGLGAYAGLAAMAGIDLGGGGGSIFQGDNILELYKSRTMLEKALLDTVDISDKKTSLVDYYVSVNKLREKWAQKAETKDVVFDKKSNRVKDSLMTDIINGINKNVLSVTKPDKKLSIIKVDVKSENEQFSKLFNEKIVQTVNDFYVETKTKKSLDNIAILQHQTDSVKAVMNGAIYQSAVVADATPNLNPTRQVQRTVPIQKAQVSAETNKAILSSLIQNLEMLKMALTKETPLIQVVDEPIYPLYKEKFSKVKGAILGGFLFAFLTIIFILIREFIKRITA